LSFCWVSRDILNNLHDATSERKGSWKNIRGEINTEGYLILNTCDIETGASEGVIEREVIVSCPSRNTLTPQVCRVVNSKFFIFCVSLIRSHETHYLRKEVVRIQDFNLLSADIDFYLLNPLAGGGDWKGRP